MKKLTILALSAVASAAFILTGCPHSADEYKTADTYTLVEVSGDFKIIKDDKATKVTIPAASFKDATTINDELSLTISGAKKADYQLTLDPALGDPTFEKDDSTDAVYKLSKDQLATLKEKGLVITGTNADGTTFTGATLSFVNGGSDKIKITAVKVGTIDKDFSKDDVGTTYGDGKIKEDDSGVNMLFVNGPDGTLSGPIPAVGGSKVVTYAFADKTDISGKTKLIIEGNFSGVASTTSYSSSSPFAFSKDAFAIAPKGGLKDKDGAVQIAEYTIYNPNLKDKDGNTLYDDAKYFIQRHLLGSDTSATTTYLARAITAKDVKAGPTLKDYEGNYIIFASNTETDVSDPDKTAASARTTISIDSSAKQFNTLALLLYTDANNYYAYYIDTAPTENKIELTIKTDFSVQALYGVESDGSTAVNEDNLAKIAGVKLVLNGAQGSINIKSIKFE